jgi:hypothetical protein
MVEEIFCVVISSYFRPKFINLKIICMYPSIYGYACYVTHICVYANVQHIFKCITSVLLDLFYKVYVHVIFICYSRHQTSNIQ